MDSFYFCPFCEQEIYIQSNLKKEKQFCSACERFYLRNNKCHYYSCLIPNKDINNGAGNINIILPILLALLLPWCNGKCHCNCKPKYHPCRCKYKCVKNVF